jgi:hypothetical protein
MTFVPQSPQYAALTPRSKGLRLGKKIRALNTLFRTLPREHKKVVVYLALGKAAGLSAESMERHAGAALSLIEGAS